MLCLIPGTATFKEASCLSRCGVYLLNALSCLIHTGLPVMLVLSERQHPWILQAMLIPKTFLAKAVNQFTSNLWETKQNKTKQKTFNAVEKKRKNQVKQLICSLHFVLWSTAPSLSEYLCQNFISNLYIICRAENITSKMWSFSKITDCTVCTLKDLLLGANR